MNSSLYNHTALSDVLTLVEIDDTEVKEEIINFGKINIDKQEIIPNALICWYKICLSNHNMHETKRSSSFMNHMALVFEKELQEKVLQGENVLIKVRQMRDIVKISVV